MKLYKPIPNLDTIIKLVNKSSLTSTWKLVLMLQGYWIFTKACLFIWTIFKPLFNKNKEHIDSTRGSFSKILFLIFLFWKILFLFNTLVAINMHSWRIWMLLANLFIWYVCLHDMYVWMIGHKIHPFYKGTNYTLLQYQHSKSHLVLKEILKFVKCCLIDVSKLHTKLKISYTTINFTKAPTSN